MVLENKVKETIIQYNMINKGDRVLVALSGGADSVCLLTVLLNLKTQLGIEYICAAHLNHGLRETAERDMIFCENLCKNMNVDFFCKTCDIRSYAKELKTCEEEAGRKARYDFFKNLSEKYNLNRTATAHNMNDQAETFLMRVISGSSLEGLSSVKPVREDGVIRPIIRIRRDEIEKYLSDKKTEYVTDETNLVDIYKRNSIRLNLIPYIEKNYNPNVISTLSMMAEELQRDSSFISKQVKKEKIQLPSDIKELLKLDDALLLRVLSRESDTVFTKKAKENLIGFIKEGRTGSSYPINKSKYFFIEYGKLCIKEYSQTSEYCYKLNLGENYIKELNATFILEEGKAHLKNSVNISDISELYVRTRKNGDKIYIKGIKGHKKLKDIFTDNKIPKDLRGIWPVVTENGKIVWLTNIYKDESSDIKYHIRTEWGK